MEKELVEYLLSLESMMFGLTINDVRNLAFQLAEKIIYQILSIKLKEKQVKIGCKSLCTSTKNYLLLPLNIFTSTFCLNKVLVRFWKLHFV